MLVPSIRDETGREERPKSMITVSVPKFCLVLEDTCPTGDEKIAAFIKDLRIIIVICYRKKL